MAVDDTYTKLLLHMDGADGGTVFTDESGKTVTAGGNTCTKTAQKKFGTAAGYFDGSGDTLSLPTNADFAFGTGDFTVDMWIYPISWTNPDSVFFAVNVNGGFQFGRNQTSTNWGACKWGIAWGVTAAGLPSLSTWHHIAAVRASGVMKLYLDGVQVASGVDTNNYVQGSAIIGANNLNAYIDELRVSKGIARWTANFTPPTAQYSAPPYKTSGTATLPPRILPALIADPASSAISWTEDVPTGTSLVIKAAIAEAEPLEADYQAVTNGGPIPGLTQASSGKNLYLKAYLATTDTTKTPKLLSAPTFTIVEAEDKTKICLRLTADGRMKCPAGDVTVAYNKGTGKLKGILGGQVENFSQAFTPVNIIPVFNPNVLEHVAATLSVASYIMRIYYRDFKNADEHINATLTVASQIIKISNIGT